MSQSVNPNMQYSNETYNMAPHQAYNVGQPQPAGIQPKQVGIQPQTVMVQRMQPKETIWSWCHLVTSVISVFLCSCCGIPAMVLSLLAYIEHRTNLHDTSRQKRNVALGLGITGIMCGSIFIILRIVIYAVVFSGAIAALTNGGY